MTRGRTALPDIRTARLRLRPWSRDDVDALHALWAEPEVRRCLRDDVVVGREAVERIVDSHFANAERDGIGYWDLHAPPDATPLAGFCGFRPIDHGPQIELMVGLRGERRLSVESSGSRVTHSTTPSCV